MTNLLEILQPKADKHDQLLHLASQIDNILSSYDDEFDALAELVQNAMDAIIERWEQCEKRGEEYAPALEIRINAKDNSISVTDNGIGVDPKHFNDVFKPNVSLKKRLGHSSARGEKGAGVTFLQFDHRRFHFATKTPGGSRVYELVDGPTWFQGFQAALAEGSEPANAEVRLIQGKSSKSLGGIDRGSFALVEFDPEKSNLRSIDQISGVDEKIAANRWEYLLRTRTAVGYAGDPTAGQTGHHEVLKALSVVLTVTTAEGKSHSRKIEVGFLYPHLMKPQRTTFVIGQPKKNCELLWAYFEPTELAKYMPALARKAHVEIAKKYEVRCYISYSCRNEHYEQLFNSYCGFGLGDWDSEDNLPQRIIQVNGGFQVCVREYPNGRRHNFLQRGGSEGKSRAFVLFDFRGGYKPDYGRKNLAHDCREFVNTACKAFIGFAEQKERRQLLYVDKDQARHGAVDQDGAREQLKQTSSTSVARGFLLKSGETVFERTPASETEVILAFYHHVQRSELKGYRLFGPRDMEIFDELFDFKVAVDAVIGYPDDPLGLQYRANQKGSIEKTGRWIEYKFALEQLISDFKKKAGEGGRKWFNLCDLLVCESADAEAEGYTLEVVDEGNVDERLYYGVTHLLRSNFDQSHVVQVLCLRSFRALLPQPKPAAATLPPQRRGKKSSKKPR